MNFVSGFILVVLAGGQGGASYNQIGPVYKDKPACASVQDTLTLFATAGAPLPGVVAERGRLAMQFACIPVNQQ